MAYPSRICFDGAVYHVVVRGNNRQPIFADDKDRERYLVLLQRYKQRFRFLLHAYTLMPNHVHLILQPAEGTTISRIMQALTIAYTKFFNKRHSRVGHVFQGRFRSRLIDHDLYLLVASRYVHLNPVRAKLVARPGAFPWSSYRAYQEASAAESELVDVSLVLSLVSQDPQRQRTEYCQFVERPWRSESRISDTTISDILVSDIQVSDILS